MTFTYDPSTNVGKVRNLIGDVNASAYALADEEINSLFTLTNTDFFMTASLACARIAASKILSSVIRKAGNFSEDLSSIAKNYLALSDRYEEISKSVPCDAQAEVIATDFNYNQLLTDKVHRGEPFDQF